MIDYKNTYFDRCLSGRRANQRAEAFRRTGREQNSNQRSNHKTGSGEID